MEILAEEYRENEGPSINPLCPSPLNKGRTRTQTPCQASSPPKTCPSIAIATSLESYELVELNPLVPFATPVVEPTKVAVEELAALEPERKGDRCIDGGPRDVCRVACPGTNPVGVSLPLAPANSGSGRI
jgi:hypothetical protein